LRNQT
jgi:hypothetical protein